MENFAWTRVSGASPPDGTAPVIPRDVAGQLKAIAPELPIFMMIEEVNMNVEKEALSRGITAVFSKLDDLATLVANARAVCGID